MHRTDPSGPALAGYAEAARRTVSVRSLLTAPLCQAMCRRSLVGSDRCSTKTPIYLLDLWWARDSYWIAPAFLHLYELSACSRAG